MITHKDKIEDRMKNTWSEDMAVEYFKHKKLKYKKVGLHGYIDRKTVMSMAKIDRSKPDFKVYTDPPIYVEVKTGSTGFYDEETAYPHFKLKINDFIAYTHWDKKRSVYFMIHWNFGIDGIIRKKASLSYIHNLLLNKKYKKFKYNNEGEYNQEYYAIPMEDLNGKF